MAEKTGRKPRYAAAKCRLEGSNAKRPDETFCATDLHPVVARSNLRGAIAHVFGAKFRTKIRRVTPDVQLHKNKGFARRLLQVQHHGGR